MSTSSTNADAEPFGNVPTAISTAVIVVSVIFPLLSAAAVFLRYWLQYRNKRPLYVEDAWLWFSWLSALGISIIVWIYARSGVNNHRSPAFEDSLRMIWLGALIVQVPLTTTKIALLLFYKRIFATQTFRKGVFIGIAAVTVWGVLFFLLLLFEIDPVSLEDIAKVQLRFDTNAVNIAQVATSITLDVVVLCFPLPIISKLKIPNSRKLVVALKIWLGGFCIPTAIVRLVLLGIELAQTKEDQFFLQDKVFIFKVIEPNASIIAVCLPLCLSLWTRSASPDRNGRYGQTQQVGNEATESQTELGTFVRLGAKEGPAAQKASERSLGDGEIPWSRIHNNIDI